jgi:hypothetical protein
VQKRLGNDQNVIKEIIKKQYVGFEVLTAVVMKMVLVIKIQDRKFFPTGIVVGNDSYDALRYCKYCN